MSSLWVPSNYVKPVVTLRRYYACRRKEQNKSFAMLLAQAGNTSAPSSHL
jgi:hypothetical protein